MRWHYQIVVQTDQDIDLEAATHVGDVLYLGLVKIINESDELRGLVTVDAVQTDPGPT